MSTYRRGSAVLWTAVVAAVLSMHANAELIVSKRSHPTLIPKAARFGGTDGAITGWRPSHQASSANRANLDLNYTTNIDKQYEVSFHLTDAAMRSDPIGRIAIDPAAGPMFNRFERSLNPVTKAPNMRANWQVQTVQLGSAVTAASVELVDQQSLQGAYRPTLNNVAINLATSRQSSAHLGIAAAANVLRR